MKNTNWKVPLIIGVGVLAVILMIVFGVQSSQNKAIALEEQVTQYHQILRYRKSEGLTLYITLLIA